MNSNKKRSIDVNIKRRRVHLYSFALFRRWQIFCFNWKVQYSRHNSLTLHSGSRALGIDISAWMLSDSQFSVIPLTRPETSSIIQLKSLAVTCATRSDLLNCFTKSRTRLRTFIANESTLVYSMTYRCRGAPRTVRRLIMS